jgi:hypothetical protein
MISSTIGDGLVAEESEEPMYARYVVGLIALGLLAACTVDSDDGGAGDDAGISVDEANELGVECMKLVNEANSYGIPNQLPEYYGAACTENFIAKQSIASVIAASKAKGVDVTEAEARDYVEQYAAACAENVASAKALFSSAPSAGDAPPDYNAIIDKMVQQIKLAKPVVSTSSIGAIYLDCRVGSSGGSSGGGGSGGSGGSGGGGGSSSGGPPSDDYIAQQIAITISAAVSFLWNRDINSAGQASFTVSDSCLLTGSYTATGTRTFLQSCTGSATADVTYDMSSCEHQPSTTGVSVVFTGAVRQNFSGIYNGTCSSSESLNETITASGMTVTFLRAATSAGDAFEKTFSDCDLELNYSMSGGAATMTGRACGIPVSLSSE